MKIDDIDALSNGNLRFVVAGDLSAKHPLCYSRCSNSAVNILYNQAMNTPFQPRILRHSSRKTKKPYQNLSYPSTKWPKRLMSKDEDKAELLSDTYEQQFTSTTGLVIPEVTNLIRSLPTFPSTIVTRHLSINK